MVPEEPWQISDWNKGEAAVGWMGDRVRDKAGLYTGWEGQNGVSRYGLYGGLFVGGNTQLKATPAED